MENLRIRCRSCEKEIEGNAAKSVSCGCSNMATIIRNAKITALDLSMIVMLNNQTQKTTSNVLRNEDLNDNHLYIRDGYKNGIFYVIISTHKN